MYIEENGMMGNAILDWLKDVGKEVANSVKDNAGQYVADTLAPDPKNLDKAKTTRWTGDEFMAAYERAPQTARNVLMSAAIAANTTWGTSALDEAMNDPDGFVLAAYGGADGKVGTSKGKVFNATFLDFMARYVPAVEMEYTYTPESGSSSDPGQMVLVTLADGTQRYVPAQTSQSATSSALKFLESPTGMAAAALVLFLITRRRR